MSNLSTTAEHQAGNVLNLRNARPDVAALPPGVLAVDVPTAATMLSCCTETIYRLIDRGELRAVKLGRCWRVRLSELEGFLRREEAKNAKGRA